MSESATTPPPTFPPALREALIARAAKEAGLHTWQVRNVIELSEAGATIPFLARYRKEASGGMDEVVLEAVVDRFHALVGVEERRAFVLQAISAQGNLTPELQQRLANAPDLQAIEDLYLPFKPRKRTRAQAARERGLEPLAELILKGDDQAVERALNSFLSDEVASPDEALAGARDIIAEGVAENADVRNRSRALVRKLGNFEISKTKKEDPEGKFDSLAGTTNTRFERLPGHRILAMNRGEHEGLLKIKLLYPKETLERVALEASGRRPAARRCAEEVRRAVEDGVSRLLVGALESELRSELTERAEDEAIEVFATNLRKLLLAPPLGEHAVIGIDPGFRTGCKVALVDNQGDFVSTTTIYPNPPQNRSREAEDTLVAMIDQFSGEFPLHYIAFGNGTASRETALFLDAVRKRLADQRRKIEIVQVNEAGASIYSASAIARDEFPDLDLTVRGAISIARRLQDPLAELIKIDPKSIGVGQYQHDVDQKKLAKGLERVVASCVNQVGVDLNTASWKLLSFVSGLSERLSKAIIEYRTEIGRFTSRRQLLKVKGLGAKTYELAAGFLRIRDGSNILDNTAVHPERYDLVAAICTASKIRLADILHDPSLVDRLEVRPFVDEGKGIGLPTLHDILDELRKPGRDPRGHFEVFRYAEGVADLGDLQAGMVVPGIVTNVTKFGCFVDVGVHQDGLVHVSELADRYVASPEDVVEVGQKVRVKVLEVDVSRRRVGLSIKRAQG